MDHIDAKSVERVSGMATSLPNGTVRATVISSSQQIEGIPLFINLFFVVQQMMVLFWFFSGDMKTTFL